MNDLKYFDVKSLLPYQRTLNIVIGPRGIGKSLSALKYAVIDFKENDLQWCLVRRYANEFDKIELVFDDLRKTFYDEFKDYKFLIRPNDGEIFVNKKFACLLRPLSTQHKLKSSPFPKMNKLIFEEFLIEGTGHNQYLPNEVDKFANLLETLFRMRNLKLFLFGNALSEYNPYSIKFGIPSPLPEHTITKSGNKVWLAKDRSLLVTQLFDKNFASAKKESPVGQLFKGMEVSEHMYDNKMMCDTTDFITQRPKNSDYIYTLKIDNEYYGIWYCETKRNTFFYGDNKGRENYHIVITFKIDEMTKNTLHGKSKHYNFIDTLKKALINGQIYFNNQYSKHAIINEIKKFL